MKPLHIARAQPGIYFNPVLPETIKDCLACESTSPQVKYHISTQQRGRTVIPLYTTRLGCSPHKNSQARSKQESKGAEAKIPL